MARTVCLSFPLAADHPKIADVRALGFEVVTALYLEEGARRNARGGMSAEEILVTAMPGRRVFIVCPSRTRKTGDQPGAVTLPVDLVGH